MHSEVLASLVGIAVSMTWSPGPNNAMLTASGATYGWHRSVPHAIGVAVGFPVMLILVAIGIGKLLETVPSILQVLRWMGFAVMLWFAWRIASADPSSDRKRGKPLTFVEAIGFQWVNPKAWVLAIYMTASYATGENALSITLLAAAVFAVSGLSSSLGWAIFGSGIGRALKDRWRLRAFNIAMAMILLLSTTRLMMSG